MDTSGFQELKKQLERLKVDVGWIDTPNHWMASLTNHSFTVANVASDLHYYSRWEDSFALSETRTDQVNDVVHKTLNTSFGKVPTYQVASLIGHNLQNAVEVNIKAVNSPDNSAEWAEVKGFNDPLVFGSRIGETPNLISELTHKVRGR